MNDAPVTKRELDQALGELRSELRSELRGEMAGLRGEMSAMKTELIREIGQAASHVANVMMEHIQTLISVVDEKYQDLPAGHAKLRADFDAHTADRNLHRRPPPAPAKRARRPRSR